MTITRYNPYNALVRWQRDVDRLCNNHLRAVNGEFASNAGNWTPALDIREIENAYVIRVDLPGVRRDDVDISVDRNALTIVGKREETATSEDAKVLRNERISGNFHRRLTLSETINRDEIAAKYEDGVLEILLPKAMDAQPRKIDLAG